MAIVQSIINLKHDVHVYLPCVVNFRAYFLTIPNIRTTLLGFDTLTHS